jgi:septum formation inhibitor MinC
MVFAQSLAAAILSINRRSRASEREIAGARRKIQELTAERDQLVGETTRARSAIEIAERGLAPSRAKFEN